MKKTKKCAELEKNLEENSYLQVALEIAHCFCHHEVIPNGSRVYKMRRKFHKEDTKQYNSFLELLNINNTFHKYGTARESRLFKLWIIF